MAFDDIKQGDTIATTYWRGFSMNIGYEIVKRTTPTQIITRDRRYSRKSGSGIADNSNYKIVPPSDVPDYLRQIARDRAKVEWRIIIGGEHRYLQKSSVEAIRAACDAAEAALRAAGEWE